MLGQDSLGTSSLGTETTLAPSVTTTFGIQQPGAWILGDGPATAAPPPITVYLDGEAWVGALAEGGLSSGLPLRGDAWVGVLALAAPVQKLALRGEAWSGALALGGFEQLVGLLGTAYAGAVAQAVVNQYQSLAGSAYAGAEALGILNRRIGIQGTAFAGSAAEALVHVLKPIQGRAWAGVRAIAKPTALVPLGFGTAWIGALATAGMSTWNTATIQPRFCTAVTPNLVRVVSLLPEMPVAYIEEIDKLVAGVAFNACTDPEV